MIMKYVLPSFLDKQEFIRFAMASKFTYQCAKEYRAAWKRQLIKLAETYGFTIDETAHDDFGYIDIDLNQTIQNKVLYQAQDHEHNYKMLTKDGIAVLAALRGGWAWTDSPQYYDHINREDTMFTNPIPHLKTVCWYNPT